MLGPVSAFNQAQDSASSVINVRIRQPSDLAISTSGMGMDYDGSFCLHDAW